MAHNQNQYGAVKYYTDEYGNPVDEYGNPIRQTDEYGNPIRQTGFTTAYGGATEVAGTGLGFGHYKKEHQSLSDQLHRSGSSSSSTSSEDEEGHGERKKKGLKEKLPGHHKKERSHATSTTTPGGALSAQHRPGYGGHEYDHDHHEHKGIMDKIKEKLPGSHHHH